MESLDTPCLPQSRVLRGVLNPSGLWTTFLKKMGQGRAVFLLSPTEKPPGFSALSHAAILFSQSSGGQAFVLSASRWEGRERVGNGLWEDK